MTDPMEGLAQLWGGADPAASPAPNERTVRVTRLGRRGYGPVLAMQRRLVHEARAGDAPDRLLTVEHDPVITLGRRADPEDVLCSPSELAHRGVERFEVERGGEVTYHGPGQLVAYPILDLRGYRKDVRWYSLTLLRSVARALAALGVEAEARDGAETGVWVAGPGGGAKIGALGVRIQGWITSHGVAINVDPDLSDYELIVPCGLASRRVTSIRDQLGTAPSVSAVGHAFEAAFAAEFGVLVSLVVALCFAVAVPTPAMAQSAVRAGRAQSAPPAGRAQAAPTRGGAGDETVRVATPRPTQPVDWPELPNLDDADPVAETGHFAVYAADDADPVLRLAARRWSGQLDAIGVLIASRLGLPAPPGKTVRVVFARAYPAPCPARGLAMHADEAATIAVFVDETTPDVQIRAVLAHEITHAFTFGENFIGDGVLTEGVANWAPGGLVRSWQNADSWDAKVREFLDAGTYVSVADPAGLQPSPGEDCIDRRDRVYNSRAAFTEWLVKRIGREVVLAMPFEQLQEAREGSEEPVLRKVPDYREASGFTLEQLETIWLAELTGSM